MTTRSPLIATARRRRTPRIVLAALATVSWLALSACGAAGTSSTPAGPAESSSPVTAGSGSDSSPGVGSILARAILTPKEIKDGWALADPRLNFPNSVDLAKRVPECAPVADLVFAGGTRHGYGKSTTYASQTDNLFTYVVLFDTPAHASAMMTAVRSDTFPACWAKFNDLAVMAMPLGITRATYMPAAPPHLTINADALSVQHLLGTVEIGGSTVADTCTCVFAQATRGVVEVHSEDSLLTPTERSAIIQRAVDKLRAAQTG
jgi:hypothetical protein